MTSTHSTSKEPGLTSVLSSNHQETVFEKRRGVSAVEIRQGYASVHLDHLEGHLIEERIKILEIVAGESFVLLWICFFNVLRSICSASCMFL